MSSTLGQVAGLVCRSSLSEQFGPYRKLFCSEFDIDVMKYCPHGSVKFVTFCVEEGLLLLCNPLCKAMIKSCIARAQKLYPIRIVAILVEATHVHMIVVVDNPDDLPSFMRHFKSDSAHMLNRILGRKKRTVWCEGYDDPIVLTPIRTLIALAYIYSNPSKDNLVESINEYPGFSTWRMFRKGIHIQKCKRIHRNAFRRLRK